MLTEISRDLWCAEAPGRAYGAPLGERMCVIRLGDGSLFVHGPIGLSPALRSDVDRLGEVRHLCVPNRRCFEHLDRWIAAYPDAERWMPSGAVAPRPGLDPLSLLEPTTEAGWTDDLESLPVQGMPRLCEVVFLHRPSRSLLLSDLAVGIPARAPLLVKAYLRLSLGGLAFGPTRDTRWLVADRARAEQSIRRVLEWSFDRIVPRRGPIVDRAAEQSLRRAFSWLSSEPRFWQ
jgi:hypothetical protein